MKKSIVLATVFTAIMSMSGYAAADDNTHRGMHSNGYHNAANKPFHMKDHYRPDRRYSSDRFHQHKRPARVHHRYHNSHNSHPGQGHHKVNNRVVIHRR